MSERPYLLIAQTPDGKLQAISISEAQRWLLAQCGLELVKVDIPFPRQTPTESPKQACYFRLPSEVTFYTHRECSLGSQWYEPTWDEFRLVSIETVPQEAQCHVCHGFVQQAPRQTPTESPQ